MNIFKLLIYGSLLIPLVVVGQFGLSLRDPGFVGAVNPAAAAGGGGFTDPSDLDNLVGWYGSTDGATNDAANLQYWDDASPADRDVVSNSARHMVYNTGFKNGHDVAHAAGSSELWHTGGSYSQPLTIYAVVLNVDDNATGVFVGHTNTSAVFYNWVGSSVNWRMEAPTRLEDPTDHSTNEWFILTFKYNNTSSVMRTNGVQAVAGTTGNNSFDGIRIGGNSAVSSYLLGYIGEIVIYSDENTSDEIDDVEGYLSTRWDITLAP